MIMPQSRDRRPRLSARTQATESPNQPPRERRGASNGVSQRLERWTDEGVCPPLWHVLLFNLAVPTNKIQPRYTPNQLSLCTQTVMFTPLSIRREDGSEACGEAFYYITCSQRRMSLRLANTINIMRIVIPAYSAQTINFSDGLRRVIIS